MPRYPMIDLEIKNIKKNFEKTNILKGINLEINKGEFIVILGPSGCGKSTLLRIVAGLETASSGHVFLTGKDITVLPARERNMAMVFQSYALYPHLKVYDNFSYGPNIRHEDKKQTDKKIKETAAVLNLEDQLMKYPKQLSGGQRQRVALGRAMLRNPSCFLFDEPLSNLDANLRLIMRRKIFSIHQDLKITTLYVTHDQLEAMTLANRIVLMNNGYVEQIGAPLDIYDKPKNIFTAKFLGSPNITLLDGIIDASGKNIKVINSKIVFPLSGVSLEAGQELVLGIRPEDILVSNKNEANFPAQVEFIEATGGLSIIYASAEGCDIRISTTKRISATLGDTLYLKVQGMHLFDKKTSQRISTINYQQNP